MQSCVGKEVDVFDNITVFREEGITEACCEIVVAVIDRDLLFECGSVSINGLFDGVLRFKFTDDEHEFIA